MTWKQPIPVTFNLNDPAADTMMVLLVRSAANSEQVIQVAPQQFFKLQRGQAIFSGPSYAVRFGLKRNETARVRRILRRLQKTHDKVTVKAFNKFTVVSIRNYDEIIRMTDGVKDGQNPGGRQAAPHKIDKSGKNGESGADAPSSPQSSSKLEESGEKKNPSPLSADERLELALEVGIHPNFIEAREPRAIEYLTNNPKKKTTLQSTLKFWLLEDLARGKVPPLDDLSRQVLQDQTPEKLKAREEKNAILAELDGEEANHD